MQIRSRPKIRLTTIIGGNTLKAQAHRNSRKEAVQPKSPTVHISNKLDGAMPREYFVVAAAGSVIIENFEENLCRLCFDLD